MTVERKGRLLSRASDGTDGDARDLDALRLLTQKALNGNVCHVSYLSNRIRDFGLRAEMEGERAMEDEKCSGGSKENRLNNSTRTVVDEAGLIWLVKTWIKVINKVDALVKGSLYFVAGSIKNGPRIAASRQQIIETDTSLFEALTPNISFSSLLVFWIIAGAS